MTYVEVMKVFVFLIVMLHVFMIYSFEQSLAGNYEY